MSYYLLTTPEVQWDEPGYIVRQEKGLFIGDETFVAPIRTSLTSPVATLKIKRPRPPMEIHNHADVTPVKASITVTQSDVLFNSSIEGQFARTFSARGLDLKSNLYKGSKEQGNVVLLREWKQRMNDINLVLKKFTNSYPPPQPDNVISF
ncbi:hypothetical protein Tco_0708449 [Tanacetum coccineum]